MLVLALALVLAGVELDRGRIASSLNCPPAASRPWPVTRQLALKSRLQKVTGGLSGFPKSISSILR